MALMAFALVTVLSRWSAKLNTLLSSGLIAGLYLIWIGITIAALTGASRMLPHAGQGYRAAPQIEFAVAGLIVAGSILSIVTVLFFVHRLETKAANRTEHLCPEQAAKFRGKSSTSIGHCPNRLQCPSSAKPVWFH